LLFGLLRDRLPVDFVGFFAKRQLQGEAIIMSTGRGVKGENHRNQVVRSVPCGEYRNSLDGKSITILSELFASAQLVSYTHDGEDKKPKVHSLVRPEFPSFCGLWLLAYGEIVSEVREYPRLSKRC